MKETANDTAQSSQENRLAETGITHQQDGCAFMHVHVTATAHVKATPSKGLSQERAARPFSGFIILIGVKCFRYC